MLSCHLLSYIEKDYVLSVLRNFKSSIEVVVATDFPSSSLCRSHIDSSLFASFSLTLHHYLAVCRVEVSESVVVPEDTVTLA